MPKVNLSCKLRVFIAYAGNESHDQPTEAFITHQHGRQYPMLLSEDSAYPNQTAGCALLMTKTLYLSQDKTKVKFILS